MVWPTDAAAPVNRRQVAVSHQAGNTIMSAVVPAEADKDTWLARRISASHGVAGESERLYRATAKIDPGTAAGLRSQAIVV